MGCLCVSVRSSFGGLKNQEGLGFRVHTKLPGLLSNQGEKSINCYFIRVPLRKKY